MKILFLNPNSSAHMTESVVVSARQVLPEAVILGWTNAAGPAAIQGPEDGAAAVPGILALLSKAKAEGVDAIVLACFDDTGLEQARTAAHCPVIGIGQAAFHMARLLGQDFGVVTTLPVSVPVIEENIHSYGFSAACKGVRPSGLPVLEVEAGGETVLSRLRQDIEYLRALGAGSVVLGCAGMSAHFSQLQEGAGVPIVDGVRAAAALAQAVIRAG